MKDNIPLQCWYAYEYDEPGIHWAIDNTELDASGAYERVVVALPTDDHRHNLRRLVALLNEHWPIAARADEDGRT